MFDEYNNEMKDSKEVIVEDHGETNYSYVSDRPVTPRKKGGFFKKVTALVMSGLLFGSVAGGTMAGVNFLAASYLPQREQATPVLENTEIMEESAVSAVNNMNNSANTSGAVMDVSDVAAAVMPSIVAINSTTTQTYNGFFGKSQSYTIPGSGSGIIVGQNETELLVATNNHVVEGTDSLEVSFIDDTVVAAAIKGTDSDSDLAVISVLLADIPAETLAQIKVATLGDSDSVKVGQGVIAIGNALGYGQSVTVGYISALNREVTVDTVTRILLQTDAAINPGNSGGALININGEVIGINAAKYSDTSVEGMGYAIPISNAQEILGELMNKITRPAVEQGQQGYIGIQGQNIDQEMANVYGMPQGVYVYQISEGSPASESELMAKDVITAFDGEKITTMSDVQNLLTYYSGGTTVHLTVQRLVDGQYVEMDVELTLGSKADVE